MSKKTYLISFASLLIALLCYALFLKTKSYAQTYSSPNEFSYTIITYQSQKVMVITRRGSAEFEAVLIK